MEDDFNPAEDTRRAWYALRLKAVRLLEAGHAPAQIAAGLGVHPATVREWRKRYAVGGLDALRVGRPPGRKAGSTFVRTRGKERNYGR